MPYTHDKQQIFEKFLKMISQEVYSEPESNLHTNLTKQLAPIVFNRPDGPKKGEKLVDIGCGPGMFMDELIKLGLNKEDMTGITMGDDDYNIVKKKGYHAHKYDMTFTNFESNTFDFAIVRHCLEHSAWPYMTLMEFNRIMKVGGRMYIEMPQPGTERQLEHMQNHYSIMSQTMWGSLMIRCGFDFTSGEYPINVNQNEKTFKEPYDWYLLIKLVDRSDYKPATGQYIKEIAEKFPKVKQELFGQSVDKK